MNAHHTQFLEVFRDASRGNVKTPQSEFLEWGEVPVVDQGQDLIAGYVNDRSRVCNVDLPVIVFGDHTRVFKYVDFEFAMGADGTKILAPIRGDDPKYLFHALRALHLPAAGYSRHYKFLKRTEIPLPPLAEQKRIAKILDAADALRAKRRESLALLDELLRSAFLDLFGDPVTNPRGWDRRSVGELATKVTKGTTPTTLGLQFAEAGIPFVRVQNLVDGKVDHSRDSLWIDEMTHSALERSIIRDGDILVSIAGTIGRVALVEGAREMNCNQAVAIVRLGHSISRVYFLHWMQTEDAQRQMKKKGVKGTITNLSLTQIKSMNVPVVDPRIAERFEATAGRIAKLREQQLGHLRELDNLFASLQSRAFRGEL